MSSINAPSVNTCLPTSYAVPRTITDVGRLADRCGINPSEILTLLEQDLGPAWWDKH